MQGWFLYNENLDGVVFLKRTFIAVDISEELKSELRAVQNELRKFRLPASWVNPDGIHMTLKFLGNTDNGIIPEICSSLHSVCSHLRGFSGLCSGLGVFPGVKSPRVIWAGIDFSGSELGNLQSEIEHSMEMHGFRIENKKFFPHLTLGRVKGNGDFSELGDFLKSNTDRKFGKINIVKLILYESILSKSGASYNPIADFLIGDNY